MRMDIHFLFWMNMRLNVHFSLAERVSEEGWGPLEEVRDA